MLVMKVINYQRTYSDIVYVNDNLDRQKKKKKFSKKKMIL